jgi:L-malate glycosyltransferase
MNLLIINFEYPPLGGGGGVAAQLVAEEMSKRNRVVVLTMGFKKLPSTEKAGGVAVHRVRVLGRTSLSTASLLSLATFVPAAILRGWQLCRAAKFDVINAQFALPSGLVGVVLARLFRIPLVVTFIGGDLYDPSKGTSPHRHLVLRWLIRLVARAATALTAISEDTKRQARQRHGVKQPITVVHLGVRPSSSRASGRDVAGLPEEIPVFITVGRLIPRKNYQMLLQAWTNVPRAHLLILGSGPLLNQLHKRIRQLDLQGRVYLRGYVSEEEKQTLLRVADGYVSAADHEGFGLVFLEAMEAGLPIVACNAGGHTDFLVPGENALLVPAGDAKQLRLAVTRLLSNADLADQMGRRNKEKVRQFYLPTTAAALEAVLATAVHSHANRH